ncbi:TetR/AcrR family transcriptional regulator [Levilactobacillus enshiensis]|uniref:TetR/AcrR family transcriptional regulator n=1 Tax=Levilactobacillus enshiensis TaxID=2590213 RepID=UPI00131D3920|nr:TetR/AcrR family transcriptional regulator [Levilactobacillus enshiensis]
MAGKTNNTDHKILIAAIQIIQDKGESGISLRRLASVIGVTTGAFYKHYANKDQLFRAITKEISHQVTEEARVALMEVQNAKEKLLVLADVLLTWFQKQPNLMNFMFFNPMAQRTITESETDFELLNMTMDLINGLVEGSQSTVESQRLFIQIWSFIQGYGLLLKNKVVDYDRELLETTLDEYLEGTNYGTSCNRL